jgi:inositol phosphorylceramide mannosyltransferase catalytic subunit
MVQVNASNLHQLERRGIPHIIHQIWYQGETQLPEKYRRFRNTWKKNHPDWEFVFWDKKNIRELAHKEYAWFVSYFDGYAFDIQRMDSARYLILNSFGGFYIDMDVESFKPIDELLGGYELVLSKTVSYNNAIMGSIPNHPLWQEVFNNLRKYYARPSSGIFELKKRFSAYYVGISTGPRLLSRSVQEGHFDQQPTTRFCSGSFFEPDFPREEGGKIIRSFDYSGAYARHHADANWLSPFHRRLFAIYWLIQSKRRR